MKDNKPLNLVIHLSKSKQLQFYPPPQSGGLSNRVVPPNAGDLAPSDDARLSKFGDDPSRTVRLDRSRASSPGSRQRPLFEGLNELLRCAWASVVDQNLLSSNDFRHWVCPVALATGEADNTSLNRPVKTRH